MSLPEGYTELEYIQATGTQFINTGFVPTQLTSAELKLNAQYIGESAILGSSWAMNGFFLMFYQNMVRWHSASANNSAAISINTDYIIKVDNSGFEVNGVRYSVTPGSVIQTAISIFYTTTTSGYAAGGGQYKLYYCTIVDNNITVRDLRPAKRNSDDVVGLYDTINNVFYTNIGSGSFTPGPIVMQDYYTVIYDANGGIGTMANQNILTDVETALSTCTFQRENYGFAGWATSASGSVVYTDGESVLNLAETGETITLYAVWQESPLQIIIQRNQSEKNRVDKTIENVITLSGSLRAETSVIDPIITIEGDIEDVVTCNYMTIPRFGRSYFITNIRSIRTGLYEISAHVDALSSFKTQIRENIAIVHKQENNWNLYLNDGTFKVFSDSIVETYTFPTGFSGNFEYILAVAGSQNQV